MTDNKTLWDRVLVEVENTTSKANFGTWFSNTNIIKQDEGVIFLAVPNMFVKNWLFDKYHKFILSCLRDLTPEVRAVEYVIVKNEDKIKTAAPLVNKENLTPALGLSELYINREDNLNPKYTFDSFIVGGFNEVAFAASQSIMKNPGTAYNPLFVYGGTGLGKTHLIQSIGNAFKKEYPDKKVYYLTSEAFTIDCVNSIQNQKSHLFKEKYRKYDLLIMDDIQFLSNKERTQEELFHLFNILYENNKQIVFSSDKPPKVIPNLEERLRSRFEGGMIIDVSKPDYESRVAILRSKMAALGFTPNDEVVNHIALEVQDNIRELEGALKAIICQSQLKKRDLTINEVKAIIKANLKPQKSYTMKDVIKTVVNFYTIEEKNLYEKTRRKEVVKPRQVIMYLLREDFNTSYPHIGQKLGGRDHTTVIHAYEKIKHDLKADPLLQQEIDQIRSQLYTG